MFLHMRLYLSIRKSHLVQWIIPNIQFFPCNKSRYIPRVKKKNHFFINHVISEDDQTYYIFLLFYAYVLQSLQKNSEVKILLYVVLKINPEAGRLHQTALYSPGSVLDLTDLFSIFNYLSKSKRSEHSKHFRKNVIIAEKRSSPPPWYH